jgi:hypothetical protein
VKVIFFSFFSGTIGMSIYTYMAASDISFLEVESPASEDVICLTDWPMRDIPISWTTPVDLIKWWTTPGLDVKERMRQHKCSVPMLVEATCSSMAVPVRDVKRPLALAMDWDAPNHYDVLGVWARLFLTITFLIWVGMTTHDLALIGRSKNYILDVAGVNEHCPVIRKVWRRLVGLKVLTGMAQTTLQSGWLQCWCGAAVAVVLAPLLLVWNLFVLNFVICPLLLLTFIRYPIRMSRAWTFVVCIVASVYGLALSLEQLAYIASPQSRPQYAVTWEPLFTAGAASGNATGAALPEVCTCGCDFPVSVNVHVNLLIIGLLTTLKSFFIAFRCLKGLRRSQWANLLSVTFAIPLTVYPVVWRRSDGKPIDFRSEDMPEPQGEVAFDPFAMMDEQLDSASTTVQLRPVPFSEERSDGLKRKCEAPGQIADNLSSSVRDNVSYRRREYIGCCGFPWTSGGVQGVYDPAMLERCESDAASSCSRPRALPVAPLDDIDSPSSAGGGGYQSFGDDGAGVGNLDDWTVALSPLTNAPEVGTPAPGPLTIPEGGIGAELSDEERDVLGLGGIRVTGVTLTLASGMCGTATCAAPSQEGGTADFPLSPQASWQAQPRTLAVTEPVPESSGDSVLPSSPLVKTL